MMFPGVFFIAGKKGVSCADAGSCDRRPRRGLTGQRERLYCGVVKRLVIIDGHSVVYRSFFAFIRNPLRNSKGENTSAAFGFANTFRKVMNELKPDLCAVVFDAPGKTFRDGVFAEYKAQRPKAPEELTAALPVVKEMVRAWGVRVFEVPGVEADDVIGTIAKLGREKGLEVVIVSSDKDILQLVGERVLVYDPWKERFYDTRAVQEKLGVPPEKVPDFIAVAGDAVDNVPGVPGIGPKRALDILLKYDSLDEALNRDERLKNNQELVQMCRELALIKTDAPVQVEIEELKPGTPDRAKLMEIYRNLEFHSLLRELAGEEKGARVAVRDDDTTNWRLVDWTPEIGKELLKSKVVGFGYAGAPQEGSTGKEQRAGEAFFALSDGRVLRHRARADGLGEVLLSCGLRLAGFGLKETVKALTRDGWKVECALFDVGVGAWLLDPNRKRFEVEDVTAQVLGEAHTADACWERAALALQVYQALFPMLVASGVMAVAEELEMPLIPVLARMEERGVKVDVDFLAQLEEELREERARVEQRIHQLAGVGFNVSSPKQLAEVLFVRLGLPRGRRTKTGYSTSSDVLGDLVNVHPIVGEVLRYRELDKLINTYLAPLPGLVDKRTGRIHTTFNQTGTSTGRLSSSEPNLQNLPIRGELGRKVRQAIVADEGMVLISADYSQIELRILAHFTGDEGLIEMFREERDVHSATAAAILGIPLDEVKEEHRRIAKMVNYGLIYGMGDWGLSSRMDIPVEQARAFMDEYYRRFPGVAQWREQATEEAKKNGFVRTIAGRIRAVPGIASPNRQMAEAALRAALNAPMQGSAADIMKKAMIKVDERLTAAGFKGGIVLQIHDELLLEVEQARAEEAKEIVRTEMENAWQLKVPLVVELGVGRNWGEAH